MPSSAIPREAIAARLAEVGYVADRDLATALWMMDALRRPLLIEGEAGVGKTEVAKALAAVHGAELIRMQCYEGLDVSSSLYEWNYQRQLLAIKAREGTGASVAEIEARIFSEDYLLERPLLAAIRRESPPVLLVDGSIAPTRNSKPSCSSSCRTSRSPFPSSASSGRSPFRAWS
jgi:MoxR-like ATPase